MGVVNRTSVPLAIDYLGQLTELSSGYCHVCIIPIVRVDWTCCAAERFQAAMK